MTCAATLEKGIAALESSSASSPFDVALVEEKQAVKSCPFLAKANDAANGTTTQKVCPHAHPHAHVPPTTTTKEQRELGTRFTKLTSQCAIVLMHEEEDVGNKAYMIEAIRVGVVDVVKFPLVTQNMRTLWQHAVRKMIKVNGAAAAANGAGGSGRVGGVGGNTSARAGGKRKNERPRSDNSGDSTASEEGRVKRHTTGSPESDRGEEGDAKGTSTSSGGGGGGKKSGSASAAKTATASAAPGCPVKKEPGLGGVCKAKTGGAAPASAGAVPGGTTAAADKKPKQQPRSTQQWRAAEQRGRRLAIKPHTAGVGSIHGGGIAGAQGGVNGGMRQQMGNGMGYHFPGMISGQGGNGGIAQNGAGAPMLGQTQTMTINGQRVQVWVPMGDPNAGQAGQVRAYQAQAPRGGGSVNGARAQGETDTENGQQNGQQQLQQHNFHNFHNGGMYHPPPGMVLVQQANGAQVWVPASQVRDMQMNQPNGNGFHQSQQPHGGQGTPWSTRDGEAGQGGNGGDGVNVNGNGYGMVGGHGLGEDGHEIGASDHSNANVLDPSTELRTARVRGSGNNPHLGLGLKRSASLQHMVESSGLLDLSKHSKSKKKQSDSPYDGKLAVMDANIFTDDALMMEEDALDAILNQARDGNLLSFDGMDEAMLEAAIGANDGGGLVTG